MKEATNKEVTKTDIIKSWRVIMSILQETGYDFMYQNEIDIVAKYLRKSLNIDKPDKS